MNPWLRWWCPNPYWTPETLYQPPRKAFELVRESFDALNLCDRDKALRRFQRFVNGSPERTSGMIDV
jgi:hypothetical protein